MLAIMNMGMEPELYWPEHRVYLYGQLAFLPDDLEDKALRREKLRHHFPAESSGELEAVLREYEQKGYFKVRVMAQAGEPTRYILTDVNTRAFRGELAAYLEKTTARGDQRELLWNLIAQQYKQRGYQPVVGWQDIYGDSTRYDYSPPFWELIFAPAIAGSVRLKKIAYTKTVPFLVKDGTARKIPDEMLPFYERPFAELEVLDGLLKKRVANPHATVTRKATLTLTSRRKLQLLLNKKWYTVWEYRSASSNTYRTASALYDSRRALTKDELSLKSGTKTELKDLLSNAGFRGVIRELFIETDYDNELHRPTLTLKRSRELDEEQYETLLKYVKSLPTKTE